MLTATAPKPARHARSRRSFGEIARNLLYFHAKSGTAAEFSTDQLTEVLLLERYEGNFHDLRKLREALSGLADD
jgi:hypothetical protein